MHQRSQNVESVWFSYLRVSGGRSGGALEQLVVVLLHHDGLHLALGLDVKALPRGTTKVDAIQNTVTRPGHAVTANAHV